MDEKANELLLKTLEKPRYHKLLFYLKDKDLLANHTYLFFENRELFSLYLDFKEYHVDVMSDILSKCKHLTYIAKMKEYRTVLSHIRQRHEE